MGWLTEIQSTMVSCMTNLYDFTWVRHRSITLAVLLLVVTWRKQKALRRRQRRKQWNSVGKDIVLLHMPSRATTCINVSPFSVKLETYLRMSNITYQIDTKVPFGSKAKTPWITLNGEDFTDSQLIIDLLNKKFNKDLNSHLTKGQRAIARAFLIMNEDHLLWGLAWWRFVADPQKKFYELIKAPLKLRLMKPMIKRNCLHYLWCQGLGRHSDQELLSIMEKDIKALSVFLGYKPYLMGVEPCEEDCSIFGMLTSFVHASPDSPYEKIVKEDYKNLYNYMQRMKEKYYPDWDSILLR